MHKDTLERGVKGKALECASEVVYPRRRVLGSGRDRFDHGLGVGSRDAGDGSDRPRGKTTCDQRLRPDEDVEAVDQVARERVPRAVGDLEAAQVARFRPQSLDHAERDGIAATRLELVDVERQGSARVRRREEVREQRLVVVGKVRRPDHGYRRGADLGRMLRQQDCVGGRLRAAVDGDVEGRPGRDEALGGAFPLLDGEQNALAGRSERQYAVEPACLEKPAERRDCLLVEPGAAVTKRRDRGGERASEHGPWTLSSVAMGALRVERDGELLRVTLARPQQRNAFDAALIAELTAAFADVGDARAVLLSGEGPSFCAGADVEWQRASIDLSYDENVEDAMRLYRMLTAIDGCPAPVVARVHGYALGGGSGLVACADIALAADDATFGFSEVKLGIIPAVISPFVLPRIGSGAARRYFLTGERFGAATALHIGLVHEVVPPGELDDAVARVLGELGTAGRQAAREAKRLIREGPRDEETAKLAARLRAGDEGQEGLRAFLERRRPSWSAKQ
jgi:methylglutaconyl-CoA hydratase